MEEGQFENLPGKGKPLNLSTNPHADPAEDTLYRILSKNGCAPEWVQLNKEIRTQISEWRAMLKKAWAKTSNGDNSNWIQTSEPLKVQMREINSKVQQYLMVWFSILLSGEQYTTLLYMLGTLKCCLDYGVNCKHELTVFMCELQVLRYNLIVPFGRQMCGLKWEKEMDRVNE